MERDIKIFSFHNQCEMEKILDDFEKEVLKLRMVYEYAGCKGFDSAVDSLMGECVSFLEQYTFNFSLLLDCVSHGLDMNPDDELSEC